MKPGLSRPALATALALSALVAVAFAPALGAGRVFFQRDVLGYWYPHMTVFRRALAEGSWPLWNPWVGFGGPLLADGSFELAYPPTWFALVLPLALQFKLAAAGHCLLAAAGGCALGRRLELGWIGGATAGATYGLSGALLSSMSLSHHYAGAAWMPWLLWALVGLLQRPGLAPALGLALIGGVQLLAASADMALCAGLLGSLLTAWHLARSRPPRRVLAATAASLLLAATLAAAIGAVQWLPTAERASSGSRTHQDARTSTYWSLHPASTADLVVPRLLSDLPLSAPWRGRLYEGREPLFACVYLGVVPIALSLLALSLGPGPAAPAGAGLAFFLVASLGRHTPLYPLLLMLPGLGLMRYPTKFLVPAALCLALLAGAGAHAWAAHGRLGPAARLLAAALGAAALGLLGLWWLAGWRPLVFGLTDPADATAAAHSAGLKLARTALLLLLAAGLAWRRAGANRDRGGLAVALVAGGLDLAAVASGTLVLGPAALVGHRPAVVGRDGVDPGSRVHAALEDTACLAVPGPPLGWAIDWKRALAFEDTLRPPTGARWAVFGSFDGEFTGLGSPWTAALTGIVHRDLSSPAALRLLRLAGVERVLRIGNGPVPGLPELARFSTPYACPLQVLRVPDPLPRAYVVHEARSAIGIGATAAALLDPGFRPSREIVLEGVVDQGTEMAGGRELAGSGSTETVEWVSRRLDEIVLEAELQAAGWLVVSESFDPGWQATVDGRSAPVRRANGVFRAIRVDAGRHRVRMRYRPWSARLGGALTAGGLLAAAVLALRLRGERRRGAELPARGAGGSIPPAMGTT